MKQIIAPDTARTRAKKTLHYDRKQNISVNAWMLKLVALAPGSRFTWHYRKTYICLFHIVLHIQEMNVISYHRLEEI